MGKFQFIDMSKLKPAEPELNQEIMALIKQRRLQILVNSLIYYRMDTTLVDDKQFDKWAYELRDLQRKYPNESKSVKFYEEFKDWDGTTGYNLPYYQFRYTAEQLIRYRNKLREEDKNAKGGN